MARITHLTNPRSLVGLCASLMALCAAGMLCAGLGTGAEAAFVTEFNFTLVHTNSIAGGPLEWPGPAGVTSGGLARVKTAFNDIRASVSGAALLVNANNFLGTEVFYQTFRATTRMQLYANMTGYSFMALGAGDLFYGPDTLATFAVDGKSKYLCANAQVKPSHPLAAWVKPYEIVTMTLDGAARRIAFVGLTDPGLCFRTTCQLIVTASDVTTVQPIIDDLRANQQVDLVIALSGNGYAVDITLPSVLTGIDVYVSGAAAMNSSDPASEPYPRRAIDASGRPVAFVTTSGTSRVLGRLDLRVGNGRVISSEGGVGLLTGCADEASPSAGCTRRDPAIAAEYAADQAKLDELNNRVIGYSERALPGGTGNVCRNGECALGDMVADAIRDRMSSVCDIAFTNGGGIRAALPAGNITQQNINLIFPFGNTVSTFLLAGADLLDVFQHTLRLQGENATLGGRFLQTSNLKVEADISRPAGLKLLRLQVKNRLGQYEDVNPTQTYFCCGNNFIRRGGDGYAMLLNKAQQADDNGPSIGSAVSDYIVAKTLNGEKIDYAIEGRSVFYNKTSPPPAELSSIFGNTCEYDHAISDSFGCRFQDFCSPGNRTAAARSGTVSVLVTAPNSASNNAPAVHVAVTIERMALPPDASVKILPLNGSTPLTYAMDGQFFSADFSALVPIPAGPLRLLTSQFRVVHSTLSAFAGPGLAFAYSAFYKCPPGMQWNVSASECVFCESGNYASESDESCLPCPGGTFAAGPGAVVCTAVPENAYQPSGGSRDYLPCTGGRAVTNNGTACECLPGLLFNGALCVAETKHSTTLLGAFLAACTVFIGLSVLFGVFTFRHRREKLFRGASPLFLTLLLLGSLVAHVSVYFIFVQASTVTCTVNKWLFHLGFALAFGSLFLKTSRIANIIHIKTTQMLNLKDRKLVYQLLVILALFASYLAVWTGLQTPGPVLKVTDDSYFYMCSADWWDYALLLVELCFLLSGVHLAFRVRHAPTGFNEAKFIGFSVYNWVIVAVILYAIKLNSAASLNNSAAIDGLIVYLTFFVMVCALFIPKIYLSLNGKGNNAVWTSMRKTEAHPGGGGGGDLEEGLGKRSAKGRLANTYSMGPVSRHAEKSSDSESSQEDTASNGNELDTAELARAAHDRAQLEKLHATVGPLRDENTRLRQEIARLMEVNERLLRHVTTPGAAHEK